MLTVPYIESQIPSGGDHAIIRKVLEMTTLRLRYLVEVATIASCAWLPIRLLIELVFPFVPFQTKNSFARIIVEMPFYYVVAGVYQFVTGADEPPRHLGMTVGVAVLEAMAIGCVIWLGWRITRLRYG